VMDPHQRVRFCERTAVERVFSRLKDEFGGRFVRVRGWAKVMAHLMFGILALTADQILRWSEPQKVEGSTVPT
jgi:transposase